MLPALKQQIIHQSNHNYQSDDWNITACFLIIYYQLPRYGLSLQNDINDWSMKHVVHLPCVAAVHI